MNFLKTMGKMLGKSALVIVLSACTPPQDVANIDHVLAGAQEAGATFGVQIVTQNTLALVQAWPDSHPGQTAGWINHETTKADSAIKPGDRLSLAVWDNDESSLLGQPGQKVIQLQNLRVSGTGTIFVPYVGEVLVAGLTTAAARSFLQDKLKGIMTSAQVELNATAGLQNSVDVISGVSKPGPFPLVDAGATITTALAQAGGISGNVLNPQVRLQRDGKMYKISAEKLLSQPAFDTTLRGGDKIFVQADPRYFLSLGAAGREAVIDFPRDTVTTLEAMSLIGGVNQDLANPKAILVLRVYPPAAVSSTSQNGPPKAQMVFAFDLTTADGLFSAGAFPIQDRDLVLVTQSPLVNTSNVVRLVTSMFTSSRLVYYGVQ